MTYLPLELHKEILWFHRNLSIVLVSAPSIPSTANLQAAVVQLADFSPNLSRPSHHQSNLANRSITQLVFCNPPQDLLVFFFPYQPTLYLMARWTFQIHRNPGPLPYLTPVNRCPLAPGHKFKSMYSLYNSLSPGPGFRLLLPGISTPILTPSQTPRGPVLHFIF